MSNIVIEIINVSVEVKPTKTPGKTYELLDVAYKNKSFQDKVEGKKIAAFVSPQVTEALKAATFGDVYTVVREKDGEFWKWTQLIQGENAPMAQPQPQQGNAVPVPKNNYETKEERAARQVMIVRQSCIGYAVNALKLDKAALEPNTVIDVAKIFESYVLGEELLDDVPM